jgi:hypothetical protein
MALIVWCHAQHFGYFWAIFLFGGVDYVRVRAVDGFPENENLQSERNRAREKTPWWNGLNLLLMNGTFCEFEHFFYVSLFLHPPILLSSLHMSISILCVHPSHSSKLI